MNHKVYQVHMYCVYLYTQSHLVKYKKHFIKMLYTASSCIYTHLMCVGTVPPKPVMPDRVGGFPVDFLRQVV